MKQALHADGSLPTNDPEAEDGTISRSAYQNLFDAAREDLVAQFEAQTKALLTDPDVAVRRALLASVSTLCVFFGSAKASDVILSHLNTYLNDRDWMLKITFFETIVGVATYVGTAGLEEFILPLMVQALADPEESVVERVIRSFSAIAELGLFQRNTTWELIDIVAQFTMHPNSWIREAAAQFITAATTFTSTADRHGIITPMIKMYLKALPVDLSEIALLDSLKKPLPRIVLEMASSWAVKAEKGLFWKSTQQQRTFSFGYGETGSSTPGRNIAIKGLARIPKNEEDEHWIQRLRNAGMSSEDEFKLLLLREYIWRAARRKSQEEVVEPSQFNGIVALKDMDVSLQTVFFDNEKAAAQNMAIFEDEVRPRTIAEALQDASAPVDDIVPNKTSDPRGDERAGPKDIPGVAPSRDEPLSPQQWLHSPAGPSSLDSKHSLRVGEHGIQRKGSAMSLMGLRDAGGKAAAEIGTTPTNAFGKVEGSLIRDDQSKRKVSPLALARDDYRLQLQGKKIQPVHSYPGNDPSVLKLLDSLYLENYPVELIEFGQLVTPIRGQPIRRAGTGNSSSGFWRPEGVLVAMLSEHTTTINRVAVAPDHRFFVTGSDDGTVKVWDTSRLERNINHRSLHTHSQGVKVKVTSLAFVESTHCFISTGSDGSVHVIKVEVLEKNGTTRYPKLRLVREYQLPAGEFAVWTEHHKVDNQSILLLATNKSRLVAIELRTMSVLYELQNPLNHGTPTCFCVDRRHHWLLIGTSHGVMDLWDLRFKIRLKSWGFPGGTPIYRLSLAPISRGSKRYRVTIAGGAQGEITTFDIEKGQIKEIYRTNGFAAKETTIKGASATTILDLDDDQHRGGMLSRFAASSAMELNSGAPDRAIRSLVMGSHVLEDGTDPKHFFILSAGPEWKVRFWDTSQPQLSMVVSGLDVEENKPTYTPNHINDVLVVTERQVPTASTATNDPSTDSPRKGSSTQGGSAPSTPSKKSKTASKSSIISLQQQHLLKGHRDTITDVALLEYPYGMVVSVDRSGVIYVFS
jgi:phosphoinositide-3-kinase regulatory subunit 4